MSNENSHAFEGMEFTEDWTTGHFDVWSRVLAEHGQGFTHGLEIGSFEGRSAVFFLDALPKLHLTCVDLFDYSYEFFPERRVAGITFDSGRFDRNMAAYTGRYDKNTSTSAKALSWLVADGAAFDLIYIDGSHFRDDVMVDALLSWKLLRPGGLLIFDDYDWRLDLPPHARPKDAIHWFVDSHYDELTVIHEGAQMIVKKAVG